jgi:hypothetical protein
MLEMLSAVRDEPRRPAGHAVPTTRPFMGQTSPPHASRTRQSSSDGAASAGVGGLTVKARLQPGQARSRPMSRAGASMRAWQCGQRMRMAEGMRSSRVCVA